MTSGAVHYLNSHLRLRYHPDFTTTVMTSGNDAL